MTSLGVRAELWLWVSQFLGDEEEEEEKEEERKKSFWNLRKKGSWWEQDGADGRGLDWQEPARTGSSVSSSSSAAKNKVPTTHLGHLFPCQSFTLLPLLSPNRGQIWTIKDPDSLKVTLITKFTFARQIVTKQGLLQPLSFPGPLKRWPYGNSVPLYQSL